MQPAIDQAVVSTSIIGANQFRTEYFTREQSNRRRSGHSIFTMDNQRSPPFPQKEEHHTNGIQSGKQPKEVFVCRFIPVIEPQFQTIREPVDIRPWRSGVADRYQPDAGFRLHGFRFFAGKEGYVLHDHTMDSPDCLYHTGREESLRDALAINSQYPPKEPGGITSRLRGYRSAEHSEDACGV